ncbi:MAG: integrase family protein [Cycloclasticus sp.]|jgi:Phage integrase family.
MATEKITQALLNNWLTAERKKFESLGCNSIGGFSVRVNRDSPKGELAPASYRIKYRANGKQHTPTIGKVGEISLAHARKQAGIFKSQGKVGVDVLEDRKKAQQAEKERKAKKANKLPSLQQWFDTVHHDRLYEDGKTTRIRYYRRWLAILGHKSLDQVTIEEVACSLREYGPNVKKEASDKKNMEYFKEIATPYALDNKCPNPLSGSNWKTFVTAGRLKWKLQEDEYEGDPRTAISSEDFAKVISSLELLTETHPNNTSPYALLFMAYTGMRASDTAKLKWAQVNTQDHSFPYVRKVLQKTQYKNRQASIIPITPKAVEILNRVKSLSGGDYVFSESNKPKGPAGIATNWWSKMRKATGLTFVPYQLRHNIAHQILRKDGTIADVAATLGNTVEICVRTYLNNDPRHAATILAKIEF